MRIFHIADPDDWRIAPQTGSYTTSTRDTTLDEEGFIHCSRLDQVLGVLNFVYDDEPGPLTLLAIETDRLEAPWQLDDVPEAAGTYPHIYGPLNPAAVVDSAPLERGAGQSWELPPGWVSA